MPLLHIYTGECSCGQELKEEVRADGTGPDDEERVLCPYCGEYKEIPKFESVEVQNE